MKKFGWSRWNYEPIKWTDYYDREETVDTSEGNFHLYIKGTDGPIVLLLHGGGHSGLTWAIFTKELTSIMTCQIWAIDLRGHGCTNTQNDSDLSLETLASDVISVLMSKCLEEDQTLIVIGHSMGGSIAVEVADKYKTFCAVFVLDVVEETAINSLSMMHNVLQSRPLHFRSVEDAIRWYFKSGKTHNLEAARVSMPGQLKNITTEKLASEELTSATLGNSNTQIVSNEFKEVMHNSIIEENESLTETTPSRTSQKLKTDSHYTWRIDLAKTEAYWSGWFKNLSKKFLDLKIPKVLILADIHELDKALTIGQMQGKFQLEVLAHSGHAIQEDRPKKVAEIIGSFLSKHKLCTIDTTTTSCIVAPKDQLIA